MKLLCILTLMMGMWRDTVAQTNGNASAISNSSAGLKSDVFEDFRWQPGLPTNTGLVMDTEKSFNSELLGAQINYQIYQYKLLRRVFDWEFTSSVIIFWMVILVVLVGIVFSGIQFYFALTHEGHLVRRKRGARARALGKAEKSDSMESESPIINEIEASLHGIKVKSPIVGLIILVISILFFYLYLVYVYPISFVSDTSDKEKPASSFAKP